MLSERGPTILFQRVSRIALLFDFESLCKPGKHVGDGSSLTFCEVAMLELDVSCKTDMPDSFGSNPGACALTAVLVDMSSCGLNCWVDVVGM